MVRPTKQDRDSIATTHVRISSKTKALLDSLKLEGGYKTHDEALLSLLVGQPLTLVGQPSLMITRSMLDNRPDVNSLLKSVSKSVYQNYVNKPDKKAKAKPAIKRTRKNKSW